MTLWLSFLPRPLPSSFTSLQKSAPCPGAHGDSNRQLRPAWNTPGRIVSGPRNVRITNFCNSSRLFPLLAWFPRLYHFCQLPEQSSFLQGQRKGIKHFTSCWLLGVFPAHWAAHKFFPLSSSYVHIGLLSTPHVPDNCFSFSALPFLFTSVNIPVIVSHVFFPSWPSFPSVSLLQSNSTLEQFDLIHLIQFTCGTTTSILECFSP